MIFSSTRKVRAEAMIAAPQGEGSQFFVSIQRLGLGLAQLPMVNFGFRLYSVDETWLPKLERRNPGRITSEVESSGSSRQVSGETAEDCNEDSGTKTAPDPACRPEPLDELGIETVKLDPGYM